MTIRELIASSGDYNTLILAVLLGVPCVCFALGWLHGKGNGGNAPWKYLYSILIYLVSIPGMFASVLTGYSLLFSRENMLDVNLVIYVLPIISMVVSLVFMRKHVDFDEVPGFDRLYGLMVLLGITFVILFALSRVTIFIGFFSSMTTLLVIGVGLFVALKWGGHLLFRKKDEPKKSWSDFKG